MRRLLPLLLWALPAAADQSIGSAPGGTFEAYSPLADAPVGPIAPARAAALLGRWIEVSAQGPLRDVVFQPGGRIRWRMQYGPHGLERKATLVDGAEWTVSRFSYDPAGHLARKEVRGPGVRRTLEFRYRTDDRGRILERIEEAKDGEEWRVSWRPDGGAVAETRRGGRELRRDRYDAAGRLLESHFGDPGGVRPRGASLRYLRAADGRLREVRRALPGDPSRTKQFPPFEASAAPGKREPGVTADAVEAAGFARVERWEARLLLGAPVTASDDKRGAERTETDHFSDGCWLNRGSELAYDAAELASQGGAGTSCICGFCVDARATIAPVGALAGEDSHFTRGPWIRLDEALDLTADHQVMTPRGPREAGALAAGDEVLDAHGRVKRLRTVRRLAGSAERFGVNLRTASGTFTAGDFTVASESPRACP